MNPALLTAVRERIALGYSREDVIAELTGAGYEEADAAAAYEAAHSSSNESVTGEETADAIASAGQPGPLIGYGAMLGAGWRLFWGNLGLLGAALVSFILSYVLILVAGGAVGLLIATSGNWVVALVALLLLILFVTGVFTLPGVALIRAYLRSEQSVGYWRSYRDLFPHLVALVVLTYLVQLVTMGGVLLVIIPGLALMVYLLFALYLFADKELTGMKALYASFRLVYGRWWSVFGRFVVSIVLMFTVMIPIIFLIAIPWGLSNFATDTVGLDTQLDVPRLPGEGSAVSVSDTSFSRLESSTRSGATFNNIVFPALLAVGFIAGIGIGIGWMVATLVVLYRSLRDTAPVTLINLVVPTKFKVAMWLFFALGIVLQILQFMGPLLAMLGLRYALM